MPRPGPSSSARDAGPRCRASLTLRSAGPNFTHHNMVSEATCRRFHPLAHSLRVARCRSPSRLVSRRSSSRVSSPCRADSTWVRFFVLLNGGLSIQDTNTTKRVRVNRQIRISPLRVIGADGSQLGILEVDTAIRMAEDQGLDLVEVA